MRFDLIFVFLSAVIVMVGCGPSRPVVKTAPVSGTVLVDGKPVEGAQVNFLATDYAGVAKTDAAGKYQLEAQPGENSIYIVKFNTDDPNFDETMVVGSDAGGGPKQLLPPKYSDSSQTELRFTVPDEGSTEANFDLSSR